MSRKIKEILALVLKNIQKQAKQDSDSPRAIARRYIGGKLATSYLMSDRDPQSGGWADLSADCAEYTNLRVWLAEHLHDANLPTLIIGLNTRKSKSEIASKPRMPKTDDGETIDDLIKNLAKRDEPAKSLWIRLQGDMDAAGMSPNENNPDDKFPDKSRFEYEVGCKKRTITFGTFKKKLSTFRAKET